MGQGERERERNLNQLSIVGAPMGNQTHNLGMCPDQDLNLRPFGVWDDGPTKLATARVEILTYEFESYETIYI